MPEGLRKLCGYLFAEKNKVHLGARTSLCNRMKGFSPLLSSVPFERALSIDVFCQVGEDGRREKTSHFREHAVTAA